MMEARDDLSLTDEDEDDDYDEESHLPEMSGTLSKWTNYIHGWQDRFISLKHGTLSYYKSEHETAVGCRGAVSLTRAAISPHEFDDCRFDVSVNDCLWYLRATNIEDRQQWINALELHKQAESGYGSENSLRRHGSMLSLTSGNSLSTTSASSFKRGRGLREKLMEMETFRDILCRQVDALQNYFDACASAIALYPSVHDIAVDDIDDVDDFDHPSENDTNGRGHHTVDAANRDKDIANILQQHGAHAIDFKGESFTFKATTAGILATLGHCIELMTQREEAWKRKAEKEVEKRKKIEEAYKALLANQPKTKIVGGPDYEEGPHCAIAEDEFFDAVDASLDKLEKDEEKKFLVKKHPKPPVTSLDPNHPLYEEINKVVQRHIDYADFDANDCKDWMVIAEDGDMKVYKREVEDDGMIVDPLKAVHTVKGVTGREMCHYFFDIKYRMDWEGTIETTEVVDYVSSDTVITYQQHKRVWPTAQRDSLFWSHMRHCPPDDDLDHPDLWLVVNYSTEHPTANVNPKCLRMILNIGLTCQTVLTPPEVGKEITRENVSCRIQYTANVNPGGWAPATVLRQVYKREYPKFLKRFTQYVKDQTRDQPIMF